MIARLARVTGRVQGVGFRWSAVEAAVRCGVRGRVRNLPDGSVEALVQGAPDAVATMLAWLAHGPRAARVDGVSVSDVPIDHSLVEFEVRP